MLKQIIVLFLLININVYSHEINKIQEIISDKVVSNERMFWPYTNTQSWISTESNEKKQLLFLNFTTTPIFNHFKKHKNYNITYIRAKLGNDIKKYYVKQNRNSNKISFLNSRKVLEDIKGFDSILIEMDWKGTGKTLFNYKIKNRF